MAMERRDDLRFNEHAISGWVCVCGEKYYDPGKAQEILLRHKLQKEVLRVTLGRIKSNLILRVPKDVETVLHLKKGEKVIIKVERKGFTVIPS